MKRERLVYETINQDIINRFSYEVSRLHYWSMMPLDYIHVYG